MLNTDWIRKRPIAHRGLHDRAKGIIENTRTGFERAITRNYAIECDLQISGDGKAMVFHDPELDRLTDETGPVNGRTAEELQKIPLLHTSDRMQTLEELLVQVNGKVPLFLELKSLRDGSPRLMEACLKTLANYKGLFGLMSFDPRFLLAAKRYGVQVVLGAVAMPDTEKFWSRPPPGGETTAPMLDLIDPDFLSYHAQSLPTDFSESFRQAKKPVISWTIKSVEEARQAYKNSDQITFEGFLPP